jgi:hypothetical protein
MAAKVKRALTNAERQARYREQHLESDKERVQFVFAIGTKKRLDRIARYYDLSATTLIEQWARREARDLAEKSERKAGRAIISSYERNVRTGK